MHSAAASLASCSPYPAACPQIAAALHPAGRQLVLAVSPLVPAPGRQAQLSERDVEELLDFVDGLSGERRWKVGPSVEWVAAERRMGRQPRSGLEAALSQRAPAFTPLPQLVQLHCSGWCVGTCLPLPLLQS